MGRYASGKRACAAALEVVALVLDVVVLSCFLALSFGGDCRDSPVACRSSAARSCRQPSAPRPVVRAPDLQCRDHDVGHGEPGIGCLAFRFPIEQGSPDSLELMVGTSTP